MMTQQYIEEKKEIQDLFIKFIQDLDNDKDYFYKLSELMEKQKIYENNSEFKTILILFFNIADNHHRNSNFFTKIEQILLFFKDHIKQSFTNTEIFNIFKYNKLITFILIKNEIILVNDEISDLIIDMAENQYLYMHFFYPEIKQFLDKETREKIEKEIFENISENNFSYFEEMRQQGENDSYICTLIRNDSVEEFISHTTKNLISAKNSTIKPSIFETNSFLIENEECKLIEYAAFYGSIQIFRYLMYNGAELNSKVWTYSIHSQNAEFIHLLEEHHIEKKDKIQYLTYYAECVKCHHNDIADYIHDNLFVEDHPYDLESICNENIYHYYNYKYFQQYFISDTFFYSVKYGHTMFIDIYIKNKINSFESEISNNENSSYTDEVAYYLLTKRDSIYSSFVKNWLPSFYISLPPTIHTIGTLAFFYLLVSEIIIPSSVVSIEDSCFCHCIELKEMRIPSSVAEMGVYTFAECIKLKQVSFDIYSSLTSIGQYTFNECRSLEKVSFGCHSSLTSIDAYAFNECKSLKKISFGFRSSLSLIGDNAFRKCTSLTQITLPSSLTEIKDSAFLECSSLKQINIPPSVTSIGDNAFYGCTSLQQIRIPSSLKKINENLFNGCSSLEHVSFDIPSSLVSIGKDSFKGCISLKEILIPLSVISIENNAFDGCSLLTEIEIPSSVTTFGSNIFKGIKILNIKGDINEIGPKMFFKHRSITSISFEIPSYIKSFKDYSFSNCLSLIQINIPSSVKSIDKYALNECTSLRQVSFEIPSSVSEIGECAFNLCSSLTDIEIPSSVTSIGLNAFNACSSLAKITFEPNSSLKFIDSHAFGYCKSLIEIEIPSSVEKIGVLLFNGCTSLVRAKIPSHIHPSFFDFEKNTTVIVSGSSCSVF